MKATWNDNTQNSSRVGWWRRENKTREAVAMMGGYLWINALISMEWLTRQEGQEGQAISKSVNAMAKQLQLKTPLCAYKMRDEIGVSAPHLTSIFLLFLSQWLLHYYIPSTPWLLQCYYLAFCLPPSK